MAPGTISPLRLPPEAAMLDVISKARSSILTIDDQLLHIENMRIIRQLNNRRQKLVEAIDEQEALICERRALISPVLSLPDELLVEIFCHCLQWRTGSHDGVPEVSKTPLILAQVCSLWRSIAISTAKLWSRIDLGSDPSWSESADDNDFQITRLWLDRSRSTLLSIYIPMPTYYDGGAWSGLSDLLTPSISRWDSLSFLALDIPTVSNFLHTLPNTLPKLRHLTIRTRRSASYYFSFAATPNAPFLAGKNLVSSRSTGALPQRLSIPWDYLTSLSDTEISGDQVIGILETCHQILECNVGNHEHQFGVAQSRQPLRHERLRDLSIASYRGGPSLRKFFDSLTLSGLVTASLTCRHFYVLEINDAIAAFCRMIDRSSCSVKKLTWDISTEGPVATALVQCLKMLPNLRELDFRCYVNPILFQHLTMNESMEDANLCPKLHTISLPASNCSRVLLAEAVVSRQRSAVPSVAVLRRLHFRTARTFTLPALHESLAALRDKGLEISFDPN